jgi:hypothetical protein
VSVYHLQKAPWSLPVIFNTKTMNIVKKMISGLLVTVAVGSSVAGAHDLGGDHIKLDHAEHQKIINLIEAGDYEGWKKLMTEEGREKMVEKVTAEQFVKMTALAQAVKAKDWEKVKELRKDLPKVPFGKVARVMRKEMRRDNAKDVVRTVKLIKKFDNREDFKEKLRGEKPLEN